MAGYDAFISYSHSADDELAPSLQKGLQRLAKPWNRRRALEVFRDQTGLSATPHLWGSITAALDSARWFVLLASPESATSEWVGKEIEHWLASAPDARDRILPVLTDGEWDWDAGAFTANSTAAHPALHDAFTEEPLYVDFRWATLPSQLDLANLQFREAIASIAAPMRDQTPDELIGEDIRQFKLARRLRRAAVVGLATLTVAALAASIVAVKQRDTAEHARAEADANAAQSRSRELAALAENTMGEDAALATLLAVEANYPNGADEPIDVAEARRTLGTTVRNLQGANVTRVGPSLTAPASVIAYADDEAIATIDFAQCICLSWWDAVTGDPLDSSPLSEAEEERILAPFGEGSTGGAGVFLTRPNFGDFPIADPYTIDPATDLLIGSDPANGDLVVQAHAGGPVVSRLLRPPGVQLASIVALPSDEVVAVTTAGVLYRWPLSTGGAARRIALAEPARSLGAAGDNLIAVGSSLSPEPAPVQLPVCSGVCAGALVPADGVPQIDLVDISNPDQPQVVRPLSDAVQPVPGSYTTPPAAAGAPQYLAALAQPSPALTDVGAVDDGAALIWDVASGDLVARVPTPSASDLRWLNQTTLAVASRRGVEELRVDAPSISSMWTSDLAVSSEQGTTVTLPSTRDGAPSLFPPTDGAEVVAPAPDAAGGPLRASPGRLSVSPDGGTVAYSTEVPTAPLCPPCDAPPRTVHVAQLGTLDELATVADGSAAAFDPTGAWLAVGLPEAVQIIDTGTWEVDRSLPVDSVAPSQIVWTPDGHDLLVRGPASADEGETPVLLIDASSGDGGPATPRDDSAGMAISPDGRTIATGSRSGTVDIWARNGSGEVSAAPVSSFTVDTQEVTGLAFSPDGERLATSGNDATVWDLTDRSVPRQLEQLSELPALAEAEPDNGGAGYAPRWGLVAFDPGGRSLVLAGPAGIVELADNDPALACSLVSPADLEAAERVLGAPSACLRVPDLQDGPG